MRRTKIVATLGPASESPEMVRKLIQNGVDVVRLNFSHGSHDEHRNRAKLVREEAARQGRVVGILADLQGPKIRTERFKEGKVNLVKGDKFLLDADLGRDEGDATQVGITYKTLPRDVKSGDTLLLDDGRMVLGVDRVDGMKIYCTVEVTGPLSNNKGINLLGGGLSAPALTDKDKIDIVAAAEIDADYIAVSFPRTAQDLHDARALLRDAGGNGGIVAKVERAEALDVLDEIIDASDVIMVARGDLGVEVGDAKLPAIQKAMIQRTRDKNKAVITATQMMESMVTNPIPTRAEVFDVANAVLDGSDAVMLSGETAAGEHPDKVVAAMSEICIEAEKESSVTISDHRRGSCFQRVDEAIAMAAMYTANHLPVKAIAALTESGSTTLWMSRISSGLPIYAITRHEATLRRVTVYRGVYPVLFDADTFDHGQLNSDIASHLENYGVVSDGDLLVITKGDLIGRDGGTNAMKIVKVGDMADNSTVCTVAS